METHSSSTPFHLPVASVRRVFQTDEVQRKLAKLQEHEHDSLRSTYQRMLDKGPLRASLSNPRACPTWPSSTTCYPTLPRCWTT